MNNPFQPATKRKSYLRMALSGISGTGKTYSALNIAQHLVPGGRIALIDTEHGSASKYADRFQFDVVELADFSPASYIAMINAAAQNGYEVLVIDSLSHAWVGPGGVLDIVNKATMASKSKNAFTEGWSKGTPAHNALIEAILAAPLHLIATMRAKSDYVLVEDGNGKSSPKKVGLAPVQRDGMEFEFDVVAEMNLDHVLIVEKTRCFALDKAVIEKPGKEIAETLRGWLLDGAEETPRPIVDPLAAIRDTWLDKAVVVNAGQLQGFDAVVVDVVSPERLQIQMNHDGKRYFVRPEWIELRLSTPEAEERAFEDEQAEAYGEYTPGDEPDAEPPMIPDEPVTPTATPDDAESAIDSDPLTGEEINRLLDFYAAKRPDLKHRKAVGASALKALEMKTWQDRLPFPGGYIAAEAKLLAYAIRKQQETPDAEPEQAETTATTESAETLPNWDSGVGATKVNRVCKITGFDKGTVLAALTSFGNEVNPRMKPEELAARITGEPTGSEGIDSGWLTRKPIDEPAQNEEPH